MGDDIDLGLFGIDLSKMSPAELAGFKSGIEGILRLLDKGDALSQAVGHLCAVWAGMDRHIDRLFEPLLNCSSEQVACILVENIDTRCTMLQRLLFTTSLPTEWREWISALLSRATGELAPRRNRIVHDAWRIGPGGITRIDKRASIKKPQARELERLTFDTEHPETTESIERFGLCVSTVSVALIAANQGLTAWRAEGQLPPLDPQWLPASKRNARCLNLLVAPEAPLTPLEPLRFEFD